MPKNIIIVGGGIAGLTAAAYLSKNGLDVTLIEKNKELGGLVNTIQDNGFNFDTGVRALLDAGIILPMLKELDIDLKILKSTVSVGIEKDIINIEKKEDLEKYRKLLIKYYPESKNEIDRLIIIIKKIMKLVDILYKIENPIFKNIFKDYKYLFTRLLPWLPKFIYALIKINGLYEPVEIYIDRFIENQSLKDMIYQHFFKNTPAFFALSYFSLYLNYFYPEGGVGSLAKVLEEKIKKQNVKTLRETKITCIIPEENTLIDENGNIYKYDDLIWA
ncbi:MAG: FAD-dependent oxidoreductase, partial [Spirochaetota bacterium]